MFTQLLVPLDGSPLAEQAIGQATAIARASGAGMDLVLVHQPFPIDGFGDAPWNADMWNDESRYLETTAAELSLGSLEPVTHAILRGKPVEMICRRVVEVHADLVVMTSHGRTGFERAWLGSVADGVLRNSAVPVLMLRPIEGAAPKDAAHRLFKRVLVPLDGSSLSAEALPVAAALAKCSDASVSLLRILQPPPMISPEAGVLLGYVPAIVDDSATKGLVDVAREELSDLARRLHDESSLEVESHVVVDRRVAPAILEFAHAHDIDLIAMSTHGRGASRLLLGSVADKVLRGSGVPMLLCRPLDVMKKVETVTTSSEAQASELMRA